MAEKEESMGKLPSFFTVFDLAFFAPGLLIILAAAWQAPEQLAPPAANAVPAATESSDIVSNLTKPLFALIMIYVAGLAVHSLYRILKLLWRNKSRKCRSGSSWIVLLSSERFEAQLSYFWYMRATCSNLALGLPIAIFVLWYRGQLNNVASAMGGSEKSLIVLTASVFALIAFLAWDFDQSLKYLADGRREHLMSARKMTASNVAGSEEI